MDEDKDLENNNIQSKITETPKKTGIGKIVGIVVGAFVALIIAIFIIVMATTDAPLKVSDEFVNDIQTNKPVAAYNLMSDTTKQVTDADSFNAMVAQISPILTGKPSVTSREISAETGVPATATIVYEIQGTDAKYNMSIQLQETNGKWQILGFDNQAQR